MATIVELWRYPVKAMAGERLESCMVTEVGLEGDRRWALVDRTPERAGKALTIRQHADLLRYRAALVGGGVMVTAPDAATYGFGTDLLERLVAESSRPLDMRDMAGANFDDSHVLIVNLATVEALALEAGMPVDHRRFRANVYVDGLEPEEEISWIGTRISAGEAQLDVVARCERCVVITRDPDTTEAKPELLRLLAQRHEECLGVYCRVATPGLVGVGDLVG